MDILTCLPIGLIVRHCTLSCSSPPSRDWQILPNDSSANVEHFNKEWKVVCLQMGNSLAIVGTEQRKDKYFWPGYVTKWFAKIYRRFFSMTTSVNDRLYNLCGDCAILAKQSDQTCCPRCMGHCGTGHHTCRNYGTGSDLSLVVCYPSVYKLYVEWTVFSLTWNSEH